MILLYEDEAMDQPFETGLTALSRFIHEKEVLVYTKEEKLEPLLFSSIETEVRTVWKEMRAEREWGKSHKKEPDNKKYNLH